MYVFEIANGGDGTVNIIDKMIDSLAIAESRANAEFLEKGSIKKYITFKTYRTDIAIGQNITVKGMTYRVIEANVNFNENSIVNSIKGVRYG